MKKILVLGLTVVMLFAFGTITAFAAEANEETNEETNVAKIGETEYATLQKAVDAAVLASKKEYQTIIILCDIELDETITVTGGSYVTIFDLNGHNIRSSAAVVIENNGYINVTNSGKRASISTSVVGGTVIQNNAMFSMMGSNENAVIGDGTGYAIKSAYYEMFYGMCDLCAGTFDGEIEILSDISIMSGISGGVYTSDPTPYLSSNSTSVMREDGTYGVEDKVTISQIFTYKGYSKDEDGTGIVTTYTINHEKLDAYERQNGVKVDFGAVFAIGLIDENAVEYSLSSYADTATYNIKISEIGEDYYTTALVITMYVDFGEGKKYITGDKNNATVFVDASEVEAVTYNQASGATTTKEEE
ncbi:MAG: hypothetical protein IJ437_05345 [Clostridia bacterium]|nr:hypothetical protein [Clostridia bacterium]